MSAVAEAPVAFEVPVPRGADEPFRAPEPQPCEWCGGDGWEPLDESIRCNACNWTGAESLRKWKMPRSRAYEVRCVSYTPAIDASGHPNVLVIETAAKAGNRRAFNTYHAHEIESDFAGRAFALGKVGSKDVYFVHIGPTSATCDCPGETYLTSAKANQAAHEVGDEVYPTLGCKHCDAIAALLAAGWFDL